MSRIIDQGLFVDVHGVEQWITLRGERRDNPVLLFIPGCGAGFGAMAPYFESWERDYTLAQWDQPRAGFTLAKNGASDSSPGSMGGTEFSRRPGSTGANRARISAIESMSPLGCNLKVESARLPISSDSTPERWRGFTAAMANSEQTLPVGGLNGHECGRELSH